MARLARKERADMRAMEEQNARVTMRGRGAIVGAGATPSMGLSQFRGGANMDDESSSDEDECKCKMCGGKISIMPARGAPSGYKLDLIPDAPSTAITPFRPVRAPPKPPTALVPTGARGRPIAKPSMPESYYANLFNKPAAPVAKKTVLTASQKANIGRLLAAGIPLAALGAYLGDALAQQAADSGFYDDYVAPEDGGDNLVYDLFPEPPPYVDGVPLAPTEMMPNQKTPTKMTKKEIKFYLQSGNLPDRFYSDYVPRKGSGKSDGRSNRAEVVRKVMREKGMKLIEASKYVKEHGLYKK